MATKNRQRIGFSEVLIYNCYMSKFPHVQFKLHKELDKFMAAQFLGTSRGGIDFGEGVWGIHPDLKGLTSKDTRQIDAYFNKYYKDNKTKLEEQVKKFQSEWDLIESDYVELVRNEFMGFEFPPGDYDGYISIINCNPRFLETCSFQAFYQFENSINVTSHELLHFMFYAYITKGLGENDKAIKQNSNDWWIVSEVFNNVVLSTKPFEELFGKTYETPYPDHEKFIEPAKKLYAKACSIDDFINSLFELTSTNN